MNKNGTSFGEIMLWLGIFVVGSLIVSFLISPNSFSNFKSNIKNVIPSSIPQVAIGNTEDPLISQCTNAFNECKSIYEQKYDSIISIIKIEKFNDSSKAIEFYKTWEYGAQGGLELDENLLFGDSVENHLPMVIFATQHNSPNYGKYPFVYVCDKTGNLMSRSKSLLC